MMQRLMAGPLPPILKGVHLRVTALHQARGRCWIRCRQSLTTSATATKGSATFPTAAIPFSRVSQWGFSGACVLGISCGVAVSTAAFCHGRSEQDNAEETGEEREIHDMSDPKVTFEFYASVCEDGERFMTPSDFCRALTPYLSQTADYRTQAKVPSEVAQLVKILDVNKDDMISYDEYWVFVTLMKISKRRMRIVFDFFDDDRDETMDVHEFQTLLRHLSVHSKESAARTHDLEKHGLAIHLFGKKKDAKIPYPKFETLLDQIHEAALKLEFRAYNPSPKEGLSAKDYGRYLLSFARVEHVRSFHDRLKRVDQVQGTVSFNEFKAGRQILMNMPKIQSAVESFGSENPAHSALRIYQLDLKLASKAVCGIVPTPTQIEVMYALFAETSEDGTRPFLGKDFVYTLSRKSSDADDAGTQDKEDIPAQLPPRAVKCFQRCWKAL